MAQRHPLSRLWLITDARTEADLPRALARLPRGAGVIFRHYHLAPPERRGAFAALARRARARGLVVVLAGPAEQARGWRADGAYGPCPRRAAGLLRLATAHSLRELARAGRIRADLVLLSPVFPTRSHPGGRALGAVRFQLLARQSPVPVLALGGMTGARARRLGRAIHGWAAIDGLARAAIRR